MAQCQNCHSEISCGCQYRTASNGAQVCASCIASYEAKLIQEQTAKSRSI